MKSTSCLVYLLAILFASFSEGQDVNCTMGDIRLHNSSAPGQGMLQLCNSSNQWSAVCNNHWSCSDATVACHQLGFDVSRPTTFLDGYFGTWDSMLDYYYSCSGSEKSLQDCGKEPTASCNISYYPNRMAGVACNPPPGNCAHGDLRLVGGESESEGQVEVCYKGGWYSVCGTEDEEASVMCKQLGHTVYPWAAIFVDDERYGQTPPSQGYVRFECSDHFPESNWTECTVKNYCNTCRGNAIKADAIKCFTPPECEEGSLRLMDGAIDNEGRVEICLKGVWGTILSSSNWTSLEAYVACKQVNLGTSGKKPVAYGDVSVSGFGDGKQPQVMYGPSCFGWENTLTDCSYTPYGSFHPSRSSTAGIFCFDDCKDGEVRLVDGASASEGTVEVCLGSLWGLVADSGWSLTDAQVVCSQLGFPLDDVRAEMSSHYSKPRKPVHLNNVHCSGTEQHILSCTHQELPSLEEKKTLLNQVEVAGVLCQAQSSTVNPATENSMTENPTNRSTPTADSCSQTSTSTVVVPTLVIALLLTAVIILIISAMVIYWKWKTVRNTNTSDIIKHPPPDNQQGTLPSRYEMGSRKPRPPIPSTPTFMQTTAMERESEDSGPLYECPDPQEDYIEMS